jgi:hypothetical protein
MNKIGIGTTIVWLAQRTLWKLVQKFRMQAMSRVCLSLHYGTICMGLFKLEKEAK